MGEAPPLVRHHCHGPNTARIVSNDLGSAKQSSVHGKFYSSVEAAGSFTCVHISVTL